MARYKCLNEGCEDYGLERELSDDTPDICPTCGSHSLFRTPDPKRPPFVAVLDIARRSETWWLAGAAAAAVLMVVGAVYGGKAVHAYFNRPQIDAQDYRVDIIYGVSKALELADPARLPIREGLRAVAISDPDGWG